MIFRIKYINDSTLYNCEDYIINTLTVPFISRDMSYEINTDGLDVEFSYNYDFEGYTVNEIERITITEGSNYFYGTMVSNQDSPNTDSTVVTFFKEYHLLKSKNLNRTNLDSLVSNTSNKRLYNDNDANNNNSTSLMWLIKNMFEDVGLSDPTIDLETKIALTSKSYTNVLFSELKVDMNVTYCINQNVATDKPNPPFTKYDREKEITYFDFVNKICSLFGIYVKYDANGYLLDISDEYNYTLDGDYIQSYRKTYYEANGTDQEFGFRFNDNRYWYETTSETDLNNSWSSQDKNESTQNWYDNLCIGVEDRSGVGGANEGSILEASSFIYYVTSEDSGYYSDIGERIKEKTESNYNKEIITSKLLESVVYQNVLLLENTYGLNQLNTKIEQVEIL